MTTHRPTIPPTTSETYTVIAGPADAGLIIVCDHAGNAFPPGYGTLGLPPEQLTRHIAYDIGAAEITRQLAARLGAPAVLTHYSRLLIDPNRGCDDPTLVMRLSDGAIVPGNRHLDPAEREWRIARYWRPYHDAIGAVIDACAAAGTPPAILSIHSFTESWKGAPRPWHVGVLWDQDTRLPKPLLDAFYAEGDLIVGDNEPYKGCLHGDTLWQHGSNRGLAHALIEVRQDLIRDIAGQTAWADRLARIMTALLERPDLQRQLTSDPRSPSQPPTSPRSSQLMTTPAIDPKTTTELEAAAYRRLVAHLRTRTDVQNIDLMNLAGFCRNCLANWYQEAANGRGIVLDKEAAREIVYGEPYTEWQGKHQKEASAAQKAKFAAREQH